MNKLKITLLSGDELFHANFELKPFNFERKRIASSFAILLGAKVSTNIIFPYCYYWCKEDMPCMLDEYSYIETVDIEGSFNCNYKFNDESVSICPSLKLSQIIKYASKCYYNYEGLSAIEFGEYPQSVVGNYELLYKLENLYQNNKLPKTGKVYTTDSPYADKFGNYIDHYEFIPYEHFEYEYDGNRYIRVSGFRHDCGNYEYIDDLFDKVNSVYWVKVEPILWKVDQQKDIVISDLGLISGMKYHYLKFEGINEKKKKIRFEDTSMYKFLNKYFAREIIPPNITYDMDYNNSYNDIITKKFK